MGVVQDKIALVTGGTSGIGLAAAQRLADEGAHVFVTGRSQQRVDEAVSQLGSSATGVVSDVSNFADIDVVADAIRAHGHGLDVIFTNAGGGSFAPISDVTVEHFHDTFNRNVGVRSLGRTLAAELVDRGIRVNTLVPGPVETPGLTGLAPAGGESELLAQMADGVAMKRVAHADEIASAVAFLASGGSSFMTGSEVFVDGGEVQV